MVKKEIVSVCFQGGLANRMFQYAFSRSLVYKGYNVLYDTHNFKPRNRMTYEDVSLNDAFPGVDIPTIPNDAFRFSCINGRKGKFLRFLNTLVKNEKYIFEPQFRYCPEVYSKILPNCNLIGLWQSEKYFEDIKQDIRSQFVFRPFYDERNISIGSKMSKENSVALHIRKGDDYTRDCMWKGTCTKEYFEAAINYIRDNVINPVFYIFTDNKNWVRENLLDVNYTLVDWNPVKGKENFRDMQLMSCARHNIISNSSYSWWGAWLNSNPEKIVVAPKVWFNPELESYRNNEIVCKDWIAL